MDDAIFLQSSDLEKQKEKDTQNKNFINQPKGIFCKDLLMPSFLDLLPTCSLWLNFYMQARANVRRVCMRKPSKDISNFRFLQKFHKCESKLR